jgi:hypothetical protein
MSDPVGLTSGPPETVLPPAAPADEAALAQAVAAPADERRAAVAAVARRLPEWPAAWAELGALAGDDVEGYAYYRVGYHRGLDALRKAGWRGSGYVRWSHAENRGFLRCLHGLQRAATAIGEATEAERCALFLRQLDPAWPPPELAG